MTCDWRAASGEALGLHYERERARWEHQLDWDTSDVWREVEAARLADRLPGVVLTDGRDAVRGFAYCFVDGLQAQLGPIVTQAPDDARDLLDAVLDTARRAGAVSSSYFGLHTGPALERALLDAGFEVCPYAYLTLALEPESRRFDPDLPAWSRGDLVPAARLLQAAYGTNGRFFAPDGRPDQWERYVGNLVAYTGCGSFAPEASCVARASDRMTGLALVTSIRPGVAHLAQLAVHPDAAGYGLGGRLLDASMDRAVAAGSRRMTLLVEESSPAAMRLYGSRGFTRQATFVAGWLGEFTIQNSQVTNCGGTAVSDF